MKKISAWWIVAAVIITIAAAWIYFQFIYEPSETVTEKTRKSHDLLTFKLPRASSPAVFGPPYWEAVHKLAARIPCPACRQHAIPLEVFKHDIVNLKLGKPVFDKENWKKHVALINKLDRES